MTTQPEKHSSSGSLEGAIPELATFEQRCEALDSAFDYRGDVTLHTVAGDTVEGYIFDRRSDVPEPYVRIMPKGGSPRVSVKYADIARLVFSGRDPAAGKSWETWIRKYVEKKLKGEKASIEAEPLEES